MNTSPVWRKPLGRDVLNEFSSERLALELVFLENPLKLGQILEPSRKKSVLTVILESLLESIALSFWRSSLRWASRRQVERLRRPCKSS